MIDAQFRAVTEDQAESERQRKLQRELLVDVQGRAEALRRQSATIDIRTRTMSAAEADLDQEAASLEIRETNQKQTSRRLSEEQLELDDDRREIEARRQALIAERSRIEEMWTLMEEHRETSAQLVDSLVPEEPAEQDPVIDLTDKAALDPLDGPVRARAALRKESSGADDE